MGSSSTSQWDVIFLDFAKAFDTVPHDELLLKLKRLGVSGDLWLWIREYLSMRFQCICIGECRSELLPVVSGVPQGSILGPLLFLVFVNDLPEVVKYSLLYMFADDTKCAKLVRHLSDCGELQNDLDNLCNWSYEWKLMFKEPKCVLLRCSRSGGTPVNSNYTLNNQEVLCKDNHKDLGVMISSNLSFEAHFSYIVSRAYRVLGLLRRTFSSRADVKGKKLLYISLVRSQLIYCSPIWRPHLLKDVILLESVQRRATKYLLNDYRSDYTSLDWLPWAYYL